MIILSASQLDHAEMIAVKLIQNQPAGILIGASHNVDK
jgi:hypothetical protein